jgi:hypothetical protein
MNQTSGARSFKGTIFHVWKGNQPCRIYVTDEQVYFIRRTAGIAAGAAIVGSQFGLLGGLAVGLAGAAKAKTSTDFVRDDDPTPPDQLASKHADNYAIRVADIINPRMEPEGKYMSYGRNSGRWHFTRRGEAKETVVLLDSPADAKQAALLLGGVFGTDSRREAELVTDLPLPSEHADVVNAMQSVTRLLGERAPAAWQKVRCEVRVASPGNAAPLEIVIGDGERYDERPAAVDPTVCEAVMHLARKLSPSVRAFPGLVIEMTRLDHGRWHNKVKLVDNR